MEQQLQPLHIVWDVITHPCPNFIIIGIVTIIIIIISSLSL